MKKVLSIIFVLLLLTPAAVWIAHLDFGSQVERIGLKPPRFDAGALLNSDYYRSFDQYFNDSFSLRGPLLFAKRWLDYRLFKTTDLAAVHVGRQGWLFSRKSIENFQKEACDDQPLMEHLALGLHAVDQLLSASGRRFVFTVAPNKASIYPEYLGFIPTDGKCGRSRYDLLLEALERHPLKNFVRLDHHLLNAKNGTEWLYNPTGTHWNARGAAVAADALGRQIELDVAEHRAFDHAQNNPGHHVDLARRLLGLRTQVEDDAVIELISSATFDRPKAVVYGDGYIKNLLPYLSQIMGTLEVVRADSVPSRQSTEDLKGADIVLLETAESNLAMIRLDVSRIYATFAADALLPVSYPLDLQSFVPQANITLNKCTAGLEIKSVGGPSRFAIMSVPGSDHQVFRLLKLRVEAPHSDTMTLEFKTHPPLVTHKALRPGFTTLFLPLPFEKRVSLSINPGSKAGVLMLQSAEIITFAALRETTEPRRLQNFLAKWPSDRKIASAKLDSEAEAAGVKPAPPLSGSTPDLKDSGDMSLPQAPVSALKAAFDEVFANQETRLKKGVPGTSIAKSVRSPSAGSVEKSENAIAKEIPPEENDTEIGIAETSSVGPERKFDNSKEAAGHEKDRTRGSSITATSPPTLAAITLTDFADGRIFQRQETSADIVVSGTYDGSLPAIEARVVQSDTQAQIVPWRVIDPSPANGIFVGRLNKVPQGGWYTLQVRSQSNHRIMANGKNRWGVGMLIACLGQSNMNEWFHTGNDLKAHSLLRKFNAKGWSRLDTTGNAAIAFGNRIIERLGIPIGLLDFGVNGSGLRKEADWGTGYWADTRPDSIYNRFINGVAAVGGMLEYVIWIQGEADAAKGTVTQEEYAFSLTHFIENQIRIDIVNGSQREQLPFLIVMMIRRPGGRDEPHQAIRNAQVQVVESVSNCYLAATTLDLKNHGRQHLTPKAYIAMGQRAAQAVLYVVGKETYHRGPQVIAAGQIDARTVEIKIQHHGGNDFAPVSGISGWEIIAGGRRVPIQEVYRHDARTIRIVTAQPLSGPASIRYLYGAVPDVKRPVMDNSPLSLPLEEYQSEIN
ncbi:MAG: hypothetical protein JRF36_13910 [Deltaproteobacteria bacterium]|jgi:hypothetical protein|nr:hypothetical protein [Deltaproteobacteria bacterium]